MPRYFFHVHNGRPRLDYTGRVLPSPDEARALANKAFEEALEDQACKPCGKDDWQMWVMDETDSTVCVLELLAEDGRARSPCSDFA